MDHPQPLPERRRGDDSGSVDAFSRAILNEKDPVIRGYLENLRSQIAAIAARHGANARDIWNRAVQDRMSLEEMERVNLLFGRIKATAERKLTRVDLREMESELDQRAAAAEKVLDGALEIFDALPSSKRWGIGSAIAEFYLRAGLMSDARFFCQAVPESVSKRQYVQALVGCAKELEREKPDDATHLMLRARDLLSQGQNFLTGSQDFFQDARALSNYCRQAIAMDGFAGVDFHVDPVFTTQPNLLPIVMFAADSEMGRRGSDPLSEEDRGLRSTAREFVATRGRFWYVLYRLFEAETISADGGDPRPLLRELVERARTGYSALSGEGEIKNIAWMAGKLGAFEIVETLMEAEWWKKVADEQAAIRLRTRFASGCAEGGFFDRSAEAIRSQSPRARAEPALELYRSLLLAGEIDRAERVHKEFIGDAVLPNRKSEIHHVAARARRGDDVLGEAEAIAITPSNVHLPTERTLILANAAIATLGFVRAMENRIAEYASKR